VRGPTGSSGSLRRRARAGAVRAGGRHLGLVALAASCAACTLVTDFDTSSLAEDSDALCADEVDNDGNGLADCADFGCLDKPSCCVIPRVAIDDDFAPACAEASCGEPDPACVPDPLVWQSWGAPAPVLCEGRLSPDKLEQCYDVGILSRDAFTFEPGLLIAATLDGVPEPRGRIELGLTLQDEIPGSDDPCESITTADPVLSIRQLADEEGGYRLVARFDAADAGVSERFTDGAPRQVELTIADDRRVHYLVDGVEFAASPAEQPIPEAGPVGHVVIAGRGTSAGVDRVAVTVGTACDTPDLWRPAEPFVVLGAGPLGRWDDYSVFTGSLAPGAEPGTYDLLYGGCRLKAGACDPLVAGLGLARGVAPFEFASDSDCPLVGAPSLVCDGGVESPFADQFDYLIDAAPFRRGGELLALASQENGGDQIVTLRLGEEVTALGSLEDRIRTGNAGAWDSYEVCCAAVIDEGDRIRAWYAGRSGPKAPWRIGLAESSDGVVFAKHPANPVLHEGAAGAFDEDGATAPSVLVSRGLYRMWYEARGFFGATSIGYAVSTDGVHWHKYPGNPVLLPGDVGLTAVRAPSLAVIGGHLQMVVSEDADAGTAIYGLVNGETEAGTAPAAAR
jgi:hypothetical protein